MSRRPRVQHLFLCFVFPLLWSCVVLSAAALGSLLCAHLCAVVFGCACFLFGHVRQRGAQPPLGSGGFRWVCQQWSRLCRIFVYISAFVFCFLLVSSFLFSLTSCYLPYNIVRSSSLCLASILVLSLSASPVVLPSSSTLSSALSSVSSSALPSILSPYPTCSIAQCVLTLR